MGRRRAVRSTVGIAAVLLLGILLLRQDARRASDKVTVVLSGYRTEGLRPQWLHNTATLYSQAEFKDIVDRIILVWNEPSAAAPRMPHGVRVVRGESNSMNNR